MDLFRRLNESKFYFKDKLPHFDRIFGKSQKHQKFFEEADITANL